MQESTTYKTMQLNGNELVTQSIVDWFDANDKRRKMRCIDRVLVLHTLSLLLFASLQTDADVSVETDSYLFNGN